MTDLQPKAQYVEIPEEYTDQAVLKIVFIDHNDVNHDAKNTT